jgi:Peptidase propeptide and YPEB domain
MRKAMLAFVFATAFTGSIGIAGSVHAACEATDKIDKTTVEDTRKKIEAAGYRQARNFRKGCDNFWHVTAMKDGQVVSVVVSPQGEVSVESAD